MAICRQQQPRPLKTPLILKSLLHLAAVVVAAAVAVEDVRLSTIDLYTSLQFNSFLKLLGPSS